MQLIYSLPISLSPHETLVNWQEKVFEWMLKSVTQAAHEHNNHHSVLERFVISIASIRADDSNTARNPLGPMDRTVFWHNLRTTDFHVYLLIEPCIAVIF